MKALTVVVLTSPGREDNLRLCLTTLAGQTQPAEEILVIDDGSAGGRAIAAECDLPLHYHGRPNDANRSRSRNLGAAHARHAGLVFLDGDMLLNPHALAYYRLYLSQLPQAVIFGYHGNDSTRLQPSALLPGQRVHARDERFPLLDGHLTVHPHLAQRPQDFTWSASFALQARDYAALGGFDERFEGWGFEDFDFGARAVNAGLKLDFSLDVWAEALPHPRAWREADKDRNRPLIAPLTRQPPPPSLLSERGRSTLEALWHGVYGSPQA